MPFVTINLVLSTKEFPHGIRPDHVIDQGGPAQSTESISYLIYKMVWMADSLDSECKCSHFLYCDRGDFTFPDDSYE